jgi:hypothetical protein
VLAKAKRLSWPVAACAGVETVSTRALRRHCASGIDSYHEEKVVGSCVFDSMQCAGSCGRVVRDAEGSRRPWREELAEAGCNKGSSAR